MSDLEWDCDEGSPDAHRWERRPAKQMTKAELLKRLLELELVNLLDAEAAHSQADVALLDYIDDEDIKVVYDRVKKWYA